MSIASPSHAITNLYRDHHGWLVSWLRRRLGCPHNAGDLAHDTFVRILGRQHALADVNEPRAWLTRIAQGLMVDQFRRQDIERACLEAIASLPEHTTPSPEERLLLVEALVRVEALLDGLAPKARTAFLMSRLEGLSYPEIATRLGVALSSVEKYMAAAVRHCHAMRQALWTNS